MKKINFNKKFWINTSVFLGISAFFAGTLTAATLANNDIDGVETFWIVNETKLTVDSQGNAVGEYIIPGSVTELKNEFSTYVHAQSQPTFDGAFNEQMVAGISDFRGLAESQWDTVQVYISQDSASNSFAGQYQAMKSQNFKVATVGGFDHIPAIANSLIDSQMDGFTWILMDETYPSNRVASAIFAGEQSGFLTGVATALYLNVNFEDYESGGLKAATYGGRPFDPVVAFMGGYQQGLEYWNDILSLQMPSNLQNRVELIDLGDFDSFFVGGFESDRAIAITERMLNLGADAIFPVAGVQTREVVRVVNQRDEPTIVLGVDTPMEDNNTFQQKNNATGRDTIPFSAIKDFRTMTSSILHNVYNRISGINEENGVAGFGWTNFGDVSNGLVSVSEGGDALLSETLTTQQLQELEIATSNVKNEFKY